MMAQVRELGLRYGILTEYTSYLVQEPGLLAANTPMPAAPAAGAAAAQRMTGDAAVSSAKASAEFSAVRSRAAMEQQVSSRTEVLASSTAVQTRRAGGRTLVLRSGVWTDVGHSDSLRVVDVAPFSAAYFELIRARPALREALAAGESVLLAGRRVSLRVRDGGTAAWGAGALNRFLTEFDGR